MSAIKRVANIALSLLMIAASIALPLDPEIGLFVVAIALGIYFLVIGVRKLVYYITMARHMVGGLLILFIAIIAIDIGSLAIAFSYNPRVSIVLYLVGYNAYTGVVAIARAVESKLFGSHWRASMAHGIVRLALVVACVVFIGSDQIVIAIFCIGLFYSACVRLVTAIKPAEIIYIQ